MFTSTYILLDACGDRSERFGKTLKAVNKYVEDRCVGHRVLVASSHEAPGNDGLKFQVLRDLSRFSMNAGGWKDLTEEDVTAQGRSPLYDAFACIVAIADEEAAKRVQIVVVTQDAHDTASKKLPKTQALETLDECLDRGWSVSLLGASMGDNKYARARFQDYDQSVCVQPGWTMTLLRGCRPRMPATRFYTFERLSDISVMLI